MSRPMRTIHLSIVLARRPTLCLCAGAAPGAGRRDGRRPAVEVYEWSVWVGSPAQIDAQRARASTGTRCPASSARAGRSSKARSWPASSRSRRSRSSSSSASRQGLDVDLRVEEGDVPRPLAAGDRAQRPAPMVQVGPDRRPSGRRPAGLPAGDHWFQKLRGTESALYLKHESRFERFLAYDAELTVPIPVKIRGGPDEYTLQNLTGRRLLDVAVIAPTEDGYRVGWLDELPSAAPEEDAASEKEEGRGREGRAEEEDRPPRRPRRSSQEAEADAKKDKDEEGRAQPLPAEGDANVRRELDQVLNRPVTVNVEKAPRKEVLDLIAGQARLRYELDDRTLAKAEVDLGQADDPEGGRDRGPRRPGGGARDRRPELPRHRGRHPLHHHGRPARRGRRQEGGRDRRAAGQAHALAAAEALRPVLPRAHPRRLHPPAGGAGPARRGRPDAPRPVRPRPSSSRAS